MRYVMAAVMSLAFSSAIAEGQHIVQGAVVTQVANTVYNETNFVVKTSGGTGACAGQNIVFPVDAAVSPAAHSRAYAAALTALTNGYSVSIYNYEGGSCDRASYIRLVR